MKKFNQFIYGNEVESISITDIKIGDLFFDASGEKIYIYKKTKNSKILVKTVNNYGELSEVEGINLEPTISNQIILNP